MKKSFFLLTVFTAWIYNFYAQEHYTRKELGIKGNVASVVEKEYDVHASNGGWEKHYEWNNYVEYIFNEDGTLWKKQCGSGGRVLNPEVYSYFNGKLIRSFML